MNLLRKLTRWLRSLFKREKKETTPAYRLLWQSVAVRNYSDRWQVCPQGPSAWNSHAGGRPVEYIGFTRFDCLRVGDTYQTTALRTTEAYGDGRFECEARFQGGKGTWPAIWMTHPNGAKDNYATYYEVDLSEYYEKRDTTDTTFHFPKSMRKETKSVNTKTPVKEGWNHFACEWDETSIRVYINGGKVMEIKHDGSPDTFPVRPEDRTCQVILSMQYGNKWLSDVDLSELPLWMDVRNVKFFERIA